MVQEMVVVVCCLVLVLQKCGTVRVGLCLDEEDCLDEEVCVQCNWENERCRLCSRPKHDCCDLEKGMDLCLECDCLCCLQVVQLQQMLLKQQMSMQVQQC